MWETQAIHTSDRPRSQRPLRSFTLILRQYNEQTTIGLPMKNSCYLAGSATVQLFSKRRAIQSSRIWLRGGNCGEWGFFLAGKDVSKPQPKHNHKRTASEVEYFIEQGLLLLVMSLFPETDRVLLIVLVERNYFPSGSRTFLMKQLYLPNQAVIFFHSGSHNFLFRKSYLPIVTSYSHPLMWMTLHVVISLKANLISLSALSLPTLLPLLSLQRKPVICWFLWIVDFLQFPLLCLCSLFRK